MICCPVIIEMTHLTKRTKFILLLVSVILLTLLITVSSGRYIHQLRAPLNAKVQAWGKVDISLEETKVDEYGHPLTGDDAGKTSEGQQYKLMPGGTYVKDPVVIVEKGSHPCWLFVRVENGISSFEASGNTILTQLGDNGWTLVPGEQNVYVHDIVDAYDEEKVVPVFSEFTIDGYANNKAEWADIAVQGATVSVTAYAIQADGFNDVNKTREENINLAWSALCGEGGL